MRSLVLDGTALRAEARDYFPTAAKLGLRRRHGSVSTEIPRLRNLSANLPARLDLDPLGRVPSAWLGEHRATPFGRPRAGGLPAHLALDGKRIREPLGTIVTPLRQAQGLRLGDIHEQVPVAVRAPIEKGGEPLDKPEAERPLLAAARRLDPDSFAGLGLSGSGRALLLHGEPPLLAVFCKSSDQPVEKPNSVDGVAPRAPG